jgi:hypothetical protein
VTARNRHLGETDPILSTLDTLAYDQLWLFAVDIGGGLSSPDAAAIMSFRERGGGVLTARDHQDLGSCLLSLGSIGGSTTSTPRTRARGPPRRPGHPDHLVAQLPLGRQRRRPAGGRDRSAPRAAADHADGQRSHRVVPGPPPRGRRVRTARRSAGAGDRVCGRSTVTGRRFNLAVCLDGETRRRATVAPWAGRWRARRSTTSPT